MLISLILESKKFSVMPIDKKDYPENWDREIRPRILKRANYCCENCGVKQYTVGYRDADGVLIPLIIGKTYGEGTALRDRMKEVISRKLIVIRITIAHLKHDEWNDDVTDEDLAALCEKCHFDHDLIDNQNRKKYGKHYKRYQAALFPQD